MIPLRDINPTERFAIVTVFLIAANIAVFGYELKLGDAASERFLSVFSLIPAKLFAAGPKPGEAVPVAATMITSMFLHAGTWHLAGNMLYLWIFGNNVEDAMGRWRFILFYVICGLAAAYAHAFMNRTSSIPMVGASGAVSGILGAYLLLYPRARVITLVFFGFYIRAVQVPAMIVLGFWFAMQFLNAMLADSSQGGIAWYAHIAGFLAGMLLIGPFKRKSVHLGGGRVFHSL